MKLNIGLVEVPLIVKSGAFTALWINISVCFIAVVCSLMVLRSMTIIPQNSNFEQRIEYNALAKYFLPEKDFQMVAAIYHIGEFISLISGIITTSRLVDIMILSIFGRTVGILFKPTLKAGFFDSDIVEEIYGMGDEARMYLGITVGYIIPALVSMYLSRKDLQETVKFQFLSFLALSMSGFVIIIATITRINYPAPEVAKSVKINNLAESLTAFIDNYSFAASTPSWANEITEQVKVSGVVWQSAIFACASYHIIGLLVSKAYPSGTGSLIEDMLGGSFNKSGGFFSIYELSACIFGGVTVAPSVIFGCISTKYNLMNLGLCGPEMAYFIGCIVPFLVTWPLASHELFSSLLSFVSLLSSIICNFYIPVRIYRHALSFESVDYEIPVIIDEPPNLADEFTHNDKFKHSDSSDLVDSMLLTTSTMDTINDNDNGVSCDNELDSLNSLDLDNMESEAVKPSIPFTEFKIIRKNNNPVNDHHQYNVLRAPKKILESRDTVEEIVDTKIPQPRVVVFPFKLKYQSQATRFIMWLIVAMAGLVISSEISKIIFR